MELWQNTKRGDLGNNESINIEAIATASKSCELIQNILRTILPQSQISWSAGIVSYLSNHKFHRSSH